MEPTTKVTLAVPVRPHPYSVMDRLLVQVEAAYGTTVSDLQQDIESILKRARGTMAKGGLYVVPGGTESDLMKAIGAPKAKAPKAPKAAAPKAPTASGPNVKHPGSRGAFKWWRDDHGNVHYGDKPTPRFHTALTDDEASKLHLSHHSLWNTFQAGSNVAKLLTEFGLDKKNLKVMAAVQEHLAEFGGDVERVFREQFTEAGGKSWNAHSAYSDIVNRMQQALADPRVQEAVKEHIKRVAREEREFVEDYLRANASAMKDQAKDWIHSKEIPDGALKLMGGAIYNGLLKVVKRKTDVALSAQDDWRSYKGRLYANGDQIKDLLKYSDELTPEQKLSAGFAALIAGDDESTKKLVIDALKGLGLTEGTAEFEDARAKLRARFQEARETIAKWDANQGGESINKLFADANLLRNVVSGRGDKQVAKLREADADKVKLVADSLAAQEDVKESWRPAEGGKLAKTIGGKDFALSPYQNQFVNWGLAIKRGINAADTGLGKTPMTIATVDHLIATKKAKRGILVMPPALLAQWPKEIEKFRPGSKVCLIDDDKTPEDRLLLLEAMNEGKLDADFVLMSAGTARAFDRSKIADKARELGFTVDDDGNLLQDESVADEHKLDSDAMERKMNEVIEQAIKDDPWINALTKLDGAIFYDEAHSESQGLKNPANLSNKIARQVIGDREYAQFLTATPVPNTLEDLYHLMDTVHPGSAGASPDRFMGRIAKRDPVTGEIVGFHNLAALNKDIKPYVFHKLKTDADVKEQMNLPPAVEHAHALMLYPEQQAFYERAMEEVVKTFKEDEDAEYGASAKGDQLNALQRISQLRQAAIHPKLLDPNYTGRGVKIDHTVDLIKKHFSSPEEHDHPVVVFCSFSSAFDVLEEELVKAGVEPSQIGRIASGVSGKKREVVQDAANAGKKRVILIGTKAGGAGLNLQGSDIEDEDGNKIHVGPNQMIYLDKPWSVAALDQSKGRVYRRGQKDTVHTHHMKVVGTYDEEMLDKLAEKLTAAKGVLNAHNAQDVVESVVQRSFGDFISEYFGAGASERAAQRRKKEIAELHPEERKKIIDAMSGLLGRVRDDGIHADNKGGTFDETLANALGFSTKDPDAAMHRERLSKLSAPEVLKEFFDESDFKRGIRERSFMLLEGQRIRDRMAVNDIRLRRGLISKKDHAALREKHEKDLKRWEASQLVGRKLAHSEVEDADYEVATKQARRALKDTTKYVFHAKKNTYKGKKGFEQHARVFDRAIKAKAATAKEYMDKVVAPMMKKDGLTGSDLQEQMDLVYPLAYEVFEQFKKDGVVGAEGTAPVAATEKP